MTELLDRAIARLRDQPPEEQDFAAAILLDVMDHSEAEYVLTAEQIEKVRRTQEGLRNGTVRLIPAEEMDDFWRSFGV